MVCSFAKMLLSFCISLPTVCAHLSCSVTRRNRGLLFCPSPGGEIPPMDHGSWLNMSVWPLFPVKNDSISGSLRCYSALEAEVIYPGILRKFPSRISHTVVFSWSQPEANADLKVISLQLASPRFSLWICPVSTSSIHKMSAGNKKKNICSLITRWVKKYRLLFWPAGFI